MKPTDRPPFSDDQVDRLLRGKFRDTTPEFEARWRDLKRELRQGAAPERRRPAWRAWTAWSGGLAAAGAALTLAVLVARRPAAVSPGGADGLQPSPALAELFTMDAVLGRAQVLLDDESRVALLNLPAGENSKP